MKEIDFLINYNGNIPSVNCNIEDNLNKIEEQEITVLIIKEILLIVMISMVKKNIQMLI